MAIYGKTGLVLAQKSFNVGGAAITTLTWSASEFYTATGDSKLYGPISLSILIQNLLYAPMFIGVRVTTEEQVIRIADRVHIGFVAGRSTISVSPATVPSLGNIDGNITKIEVFVYRFHDTIVTSGNVCRVNLIINDPVEYIAPQPAIGNDLTVYQIPDYLGIAYPPTTVAIAAASTKTSIFATPPDDIEGGYRHLIEYVSVSMQPTPFPGDLFVYAVINQGFVITAINNEQVIAGGMSETDRFVTWELPRPLQLGIGDKFNIYVNNNNPSNAYDVTALGLIRYTF